MEIVVKRIAKKKTYTIGHLYILNDKDVKRTWRSGVKIGDKRIFEHSFDKAKLDKEHYFCDTLEPTWRNLLGIELKPEEEDGRYSRVSGKKARKIPGHTAIPEGLLPLPAPSRQNRVRPPFAAASIRRRYHHRYGSFCFVSAITGYP